MMILPDDKQQTIQEIGQTWASTFEVNNSSYLDELRVSGQEANYKKLQLSKWELVSGLQKSIRRGHVQPAIDCLRTLMDDDKTYLLWRYRIIASEDISTGDSRLASAMVYASAFQKKLSIEDCDSLLVGATIKACEAIKNKGPFYGAWVAGHLVDVKQIFSRGDSELSGCFKDSKVAEQILYLNALCGTKYAPLGDFQRDGNLDELTSLISGVNISESDKTLFFMSLATQKERHFLGIVPTALAENNLPKKVKETEFANSFKNGVPVAAMDGHTRIGKAKIYNLLKSGSLNSEIGMYPKDKQANIIKRIWFLLEGGKVNREYESDLTRKIKLAVFDEFVRPWPITTEHVKKTLITTNPKRTVRR